MRNIVEKSIQIDFALTDNLHLKVKVRDLITGNIIPDDEILPFIAMGVQATAPFGRFKTMNGQPLDDLIKSLE